MNNIKLSIRSYNLMMQSHRHDYCQLVLPISGFIDITIAGEQALIGVRQCAIINKNELHAFSAQEQAKFLVADLDLLPQNFNQLDTHFVGISDAMQAFVWYLEKQLYELTPAIIEQQLSQYFYVLLAEQQFSTRYDSRLSSVITYLEQNLAEPINLSQMADIACLSLSQFKALFRQQTGKTAGQYLLSLRMEKARALLTYTDAPVSRVAEQVGYTDLSAFSRRFSAYFGQSPRNFLQR